MSYGFEVRFTPVELSIDQAAARLAPVLERHGIVYRGEVSRLVNVGGSPSLFSLDSYPVPRLEDLSVVAKRWFGVGLVCVWPHVGEVYVQLFKLPAGKLSLVYNEDRSAFRARMADRALVEPLIGMLVDVLAALDSELCVYDSEQLDGYRRASITEVAHILGSASFDSGACEGLVVGARRSLERVFGEHPAGVRGQVEQRGERWLVLNRLVTSA